MTDSIKLIHLADTHIGFNAFARTGARGRNIREMDIERSFLNAIEQIIALNPDLIVIGGDVFHMPRPTNAAIMAAFAGFKRLRAELPAAEIVMVAGNHDRPRTTDQRCLLHLFAEQLRFHVAAEKAERFALRDGAISVLAFPEGAERISFEPDSSARFNVLLIHGEVEGVIRRAGQKPAHDEIKLEEISSPEWSYIALGHYHTYQQVADRAFYSGSLDYASTDIWSESRIESERSISKGFIERDLATGDHRFHKVENPRRVIDLPEIDAKGHTSEEISAMIAERCASCEGGIDDQIVRLVVRDIEKHIIRDLDHRMIRKLQARAMKLLLDFRRPNEDQLARGEAPARMRVSLTEFVRHHLETRDLPAGMDRAALVELGMDYLQKAADKIKIEPLGDKQGAL